jgi:hypothetical protein
VAKKELTSTQSELYRSVLAEIERKIYDLDNLSRSGSEQKPIRRIAADSRDAWIIARDALEKVVRRDQERRADGQAKSRV